MMLKLFLDCFIIIKDENKIPFLDDNNEDNSFSYLYEDDGNLIDFILDDNDDAIQLHHVEGDDENIKLFTFGYWWW